MSGWDALAWFLLGATAALACAGAVVQICEAVFIPPLDRPGPLSFAAGGLLTSSMVPLIGVVALNETGLA